MLILINGHAPISDLRVKSLYSSSHSVHLDCPHQNVVCENNLCYLDSLQLSSLIVFLCIGQPWTDLKCYGPHGNRLTTGVGEFRGDLKSLH